MKAIGAKGDWNLCGSDPFNIMFNSGDRKLFSCVFSGERVTMLIRHTSGSSVC